MKKHEILLKPSVASDLDRIRKCDAAVIEHINDSEIEDFLLERSRRFRQMLARSRREKGGMTLPEYRKSRGL